MTVMPGSGSGVMTRVIVDLDRSIAGSCPESRGTVT